MATSALHTSTYRKDTYCGELRKAAQVGTKFSGGQGYFVGGLVVSAQGHTLEGRKARPGAVHTLLCSRGSDHGSTRPGPPSHGATAPGASPEQSPLDSCPARWPKSLGVNLGTISPTSIKWSQSVEPKGRNRLSVSNFSNNCPPGALPYSLTPRGRILPKIKRHLTGKPARKTSLKKIYVEVTLKNQQLSELRYHPSWSNHVG
jgi:hypothetical protein